MIVQAAAHSLNEQLFDFISQIKGLLTYLLRHIASLRKLCSGLTAQSFIIDITITKEVSNIKPVNHYVDKTKIPVKPITERTADEVSANQIFEPVLLHL